MECFKYTFNILVVSDGIYAINLGGLQADLNGGVRRGGAPPVKKKKKGTASVETNSDKLGVIDKECFKYVFIILVVSDGMF